MPRLPTILVIGSHAISTGSSPPAAAAVSSVAVMASSSPLPLGPVTSGQLAARLPPFGLRIDGVERDTAQRPDNGPVQDRRAGRDLAARRLVHERHELVREPGHGAADADA